MDNDKNGVNAWREAFHSLKRRDRERVLIDIVRGLNKLTGRFLESVENETFVSIFSNEMDEIVESDLLPNILQILCNVKESAGYMEDELECGKRIDIMMPSIINNLENDFGDINWLFTTVYAMAAVQKEKDTKDRREFSRMPTCNNGIISTGFETPEKKKSTGIVINISDYQKYK